MKVLNFKMALCFSFLVGALAFLLLENNQDLATSSFGDSMEVYPENRSKFIDSGDFLEMAIRTDKYTMEIPTIYISTTQGNAELAGLQNKVKSSRYVTSTSYTLVATTQGTIEGEHSYPNKKSIKLAAL